MFEIIAKGPQSALPAANPERIISFVFPHQDICGRPSSKLALALVMPPLLFLSDAAASVTPTPNLGNINCEILLFVYSNDIVIPDRKVKDNLH